MLEGDDVYSSYSAEMAVIARDDINIDRAIEWLRGSGDLILWNDINKARTGRIVGEVAFERVNNCWMEATVPFFFQPFRKSVHANLDASRITSSTTYYNPGDVKSFPKITINATSAGQVLSFSVNDSVFTVDLTGMADTGCVVWSDANIVSNYSGTSIFTEKSTGNFPVFNSGNNTITLISGISSLDIEPNWRWL
jgi:phage-related protein